MFVSSYIEEQHLVDHSLRMERERQPFGFCLMILVRHDEVSLNELKNRTLNPETTSKVSFSFDYLK